MKALLLSRPFVAFIATSFIFPTLVAGVQGVGGWYIEESSCSVAQIAFLDKYLNRARVAHVNVATFLTQYEITPAIHDLLSQIVGGVAEYAALTAATVFDGGYDAY